MNHLSEEEVQLSEYQPDPRKLFLVNWAFPLAYLCLIAIALRFGRGLIPVPPVEPWLAYVMLAVAVWADATGTVIAKARNTSAWNRSPVFNSMAWPFVGIMLLILEYGTMAFFLFASWRWFIFALMLHQLLRLSGLVRKMCSAILMGGCLAILTAMQRRR